MDVEWHWLVVVLAIFGEMMLIGLAWFVAAIKGRSPLLWAILTVFFPIIALLMLFILPPRLPPADDAAKE